MYKLLFLAINFLSLITPNCFAQHKKAIKYAIPIKLNNIHQDSTCVTYEELLLSSTLDVVSGDGVVTGFQISTMWPGRDIGGPVSSQDNHITKKQRELLAEWFKNTNCKVMIDDITVRTGNETSKGTVLLLRHKKKTTHVSSSKH